MFVPYCQLFNPFHEKYFFFHKINLLMPEVRERDDEVAEIAAR
jgi:hypothetical protein